MIDEVGCQLNFGGVQKLGGTLPQSSENPCSPFSALSLILMACEGGFADFLR